MFDTPPTNAAAAIPTLARAAEYANAVIGGGNQTAEIRIAPGLYDPASVWLCNVLFVAYNADLTARKWASNSTGSASTPNNYFDGSGYDDFNSSVNFWSYRLNLRNALSADNNLHVNLQPRQMTFNRGMDWIGGFHFLGLAEIIKAVGSSLIPISTFLSAPVLPPLTDFTSNTTSNVDTLLSSIRTLNGRNASYRSWTAGALINIASSSADSVVIRDCVFGPGLPSRKEDLGAPRNPLIQIRGSANIDVRNVYIRGKTRVTSAGMGVTNNLPLASNAHYGSSTVSSPWTWEQTYHTFIGPAPASFQDIRLRFGGRLRVDTNPSVSGVTSYYQDLSGKLLPNHVHLLTSSGTVPSTTSTGPFFDQFIHSFSTLNVGRSWEGVFVGGLQGFVGQFGSNGYNSSKTRGVLGGNAGSVDPETGFSFVLGQDVGSDAGRSIFQRAGIAPGQSVSSARPTFDSNATEFGEGFPAGLNPPITTDTSGSAALNVGLRSYKRGISVEFATTIPATNVIL
jgi:hypothetical protein